MPDDMAGEIADDSADPRGKKDARIIVFCKAPVPGAVKTRLVPPLTEDEAADLHRELATRLLNECLSAEVASMVLYCDPDPSHEFFAAFDVEKRTQCGADLGERMANAIGEVLVGNTGRAVLIGTDCPNLTVRYVEHALAVLFDHDAAIGPAEDGGYGLIGLAASQPEVFTNIEWGGDHVCAETCRRFNALRFNFALLPLLWDVDRPEDIQRYQESCSAS